MIHNSALKIIISLLLLLFSTKMFATEKKRLAVLDFSANNTSPTYARIIRNQIEVSLYRTNVFDILERNKMELILKEQEFETTGCIDTSCAIRIGKLLSVDYVALGSIDKMTAFMISVKFIDIKEGYVKFADSQSAVDENAIPAALDKLAQEAAKGIYSDNRITMKKTDITDTPPKKGGKSGIYAWMSVGFGAFALLSAGSGVYFNMKVNEANDDYDKLDDQKHDTTYPDDIAKLEKKLDNKEEDADNYVLCRNISYGIGAVTLLTSFYFLYKYINYEPYSENIQSIKVIPVFYANSNVFKSLNNSGERFVGAGIVFRF